MGLCSKDPGTRQAGEAEDNQSDADHEDSDGEGELGVGRDVVFHPEEAEDGY